MLNTPLGALAGLAVLAGLLMAAQAPDSGPVLRFSAIPDHDATRLAQKFGPVAEYLSRALGVEVEYVPSADYQASVEMFKNGDIQLAWFGGLTGVQARQAVAGARAIAQGVEDPRYYSYFVAHASTGLERAEAFPTAIAQLPFTFGSESSTSGRLMPEYFIRAETGRAPGEFFTHPYGFSGSHSKTAELVQEGGRIKAGVLNYRTYDQLVAEGRVDPDVCRVIWKTPHYADYNFTAHPDLETMFGDGFIDRLQEELVEMRSPELLGAFQRSALIPAGNAEFEEIAAVARELRMLR